MHILLDSDGVMANFVNASLKAHNRPETHNDIHKWNYFLDWGITPAQFWAPMMTYDFWVNIEPYEWAHNLLARLQDIADVTILTAPSSHNPHCASAKAEWFRQHFGLTNDDLMVGSKKWLMAKPEHVLVDDSPDNIRMFEAHGGTGILFPQPWNSAPEIPGDWETIVDRVAALK